MARELKESDGGSPSPNVLRVMLAFRKWGWTGVWVQVVLGVISGVILLLASFRNPTAAPASNPGTLPGLAFAWFGLLIVGLSIFWNFRYTQTAKKLKSADRPNKAQTIKLLKIGLLVSLVGMLITLLGASAIVGSLTAKSFTPQMQANNFVPITVQPIDMLVVQANINIILAHFAGLSTSLWLLNRVTDRPT